MSLARLKFPFLIRFVGEYKFKKMYFNVPMHRLTDLEQYLADWSLLVESRSESEIDVELPF